MCVFASQYLRTALIIAARNGKIDAVKILLNEKANLHVQDKV